MSRLKDLTGQKFGRWTVIERAGSNEHHRALWKCQCVCGNTNIVNSECLTRGNSKSCGCLNDEVRKSGNNRRTHGMCGTRLYRTWKAIHRRCDNPNTEDYQRWYGSKGITVCDEWSKFEPFYDWAMNNGYRDDLTIDRTDFNKGYCPENCRWITLKEQANNKSNVVKIEINGETHTISEWAEITGLPRSTIHQRYYDGKRGEDLIKPKMKGVMSHEAPSQDTVVSQNYQVKDEILTLYE